MCTSVQVGQVSPVCVCLAHAVMWAQDYCRLHSASCTALQIIIIWGAEACSHVNDEVLFLKCEITPHCGWGCGSAITLLRQLDRWAFKWSSCRSILKSFNLNCFQLVRALHAHSASFEKKEATARVELWQKREATARLLIMVAAVWMLQKMHFIKTWQYFLI